MPSSSGSTLKLTTTDPAEISLTRTRSEVTPSLEAMSFLNLLSKDFRSALPGGIVVMSAKSVSFALTLPAGSAGVTISLGDVVLLLLLSEAANAIITRVSSTPMPTAKYLRPLLVALLTGIFCR
jgi:hypothetical protein